MERGFTVNAPTVVSEVIDGEAVIMNLKIGHYFSTDGSGGLIWNGIERGMSRDRILALLQATYDGAPAAIAQDLDRFLGELLAHELVRESEAASGAHADSPSPGTRRAFVAPTLNVFTDMKDLLLLDPIHDVDEVGWPTVKPPGGA